jgi:hypothetical protein
MILPPATTWSDEPTVDRTLAGLNLKSSITLAMALSQFLAAALRLTLLRRGKLDTVQQEMMVKNLLFMLPAVGAVLKFYQTKGRSVQHTTPHNTTSELDAGTCLYCLCAFCCST